MSKIVINEEGCIGCGACIGTINEVFDFNDDGYAVVKDGIDYDKLSDEQKSDVKDAIDGCPTAAISIEEK